MIAHTYRAVLRGDHVDWIDSPPNRRGDTQVQITLLEPEAEPEEERRARRKAAVAALSSARSSDGGAGTASCSPGVGSVPAARSTV